MTWTVTRTGMGTKTYAAVRVVEGGALECQEWTKNWSGVPGDHPVAYYGPGMWVSAVRDEE